MKYSICCKCSFRLFGPFWRETGAAARGVNVDIMIIIIAVDVVVVVVIGIVVAVVETQFPLAGEREIER